MADLADGERIEVQGSAKAPYVLKNLGGVYSCTCPAWRNQSLGLEKRTCKHLRKLRGDAAEEARVGAAALAPARPKREAVKGAGASAAPPLLLAHAWENDVDLSGWWMSEKLDGVRAYWDGHRFWSRQGNEFLAPDFFVEGLPDFPLDGELWLGRKKFQRCVSIVRRQDRSAEWKALTYVVFDAPAHGGPFEERLELLSGELSPKKLSWLTVHPHQRCQGLAHLESELARVEALGGEGLMLRQPGSKYEVGRSASLLKVKRFKDDEAVVMGHTAGQGRHAGRVGALEVQLKDGTRFSVGTGLSDEERSRPPALGTIITFRYQELSEDGVPRFPSYVGVRADPDEQAFAKVKAALPGPAPTGAVAPPAAPTATGSQTRRFELDDGNTRKFWELTLSGTSFTVRFGRLGATGQTQLKDYGDEARARAEAEKLVTEKVRKGYVEKA